LPFEKTLMDKITVYLCSDYAPKMAKLKKNGKKNFTQILKISCPVKNICIKIWPVNKKVLNSCNCVFTSPLEVMT